MSILTEALDRCDQRDLIMMMLVEKLRHGGEPAHATAVASLIRGAPIPEVDRTLMRLVQEVGVLDIVQYRDNLTGRRPRSYCVNSLGAEVLNEGIEGWTPSELEQSRRDLMMRSAQVGSLRRNGTG